jgi:hypothetical protein
MSYIRYDKDNAQVVPQPGFTTVVAFGSTEGWSTITYEEWNADYIAYEYNSPAGVGTRTPAPYQRYRYDPITGINTAVSVGVYQRHDENNVAIYT